MQLNNIVIRKGKIDDAEDFSRLVLLSAPAFSAFFFGPNAGEIMKSLFQQPRNLFNFEHSYFIEANDKITGMVLGYSWNQNKREELHTGWLLVKYLKWRFFSRLFYMLKAYKMVKIKENEYYVSSIAVYPEFRGLGLGTKLLLEIEREARETGSNKIVLDVETSNQRALKLYEKLGYVIETPAFKIKTFESFRMGKIISKILEQ